MSTPFDFLEPLSRLQDKIDELRQLSETSGVDVSREVASLEAKLTAESERLFASLTPWQRVQLARHPLRPQTSDYLAHACQEVVPLAGDRLFGNDEAIVCALATWDGIRCLVVGQQKGKDVHERRRCNFGMPHPEGYRKALLKMRLAERFALPVVCLINTPGAFPGIEAEERGQSIAIAENIREMAALRVPIVVAVIGEGGSGGALGIGVGDRLLMLQNSYFSVISPEGCAAILWKDGAMREVAAERLGLTAEVLQRLGIVDEVVPEPPGGAHRRPQAMAEILRAAVARHLRELLALPLDALLERRYRKLRAIGSVIEPPAASA
ncbi:MAG: acetyl-CoA carboxylase carboxyltransferase subunit alpha [Planctomycetota bacterium]|nr:acetyl-CoA carboxylase carboxyltransferase subunit alpha [Planctomycetota bacterium]MCX8039670.1 acetyl-CoA carboxylase carboxyltransferase subunit alpha [Planctomycetota bacterium]MDW8372248.1 acetyl-CoA carboxylase carboxyltransferase subunit alpha [Planctomycetota bacterium]